jgi:uncharacterized heparinase superfamily protein
VSALARYFHTVRYLRPIQVAGRVWLHLHRATAEMREAPAPRSRPCRYVTPIERAPSLVAPEVFRFLNEERRCATAADWKPPGASKLWVYNLHYFDDLNACGAGSRIGWHRALLPRWVQENPPGRNEAWEAYPVSRRIMNWVKWAARGNDLPAACLTSLAMQARWLISRLEYHLLANHLLTNAAALTHAGLYFQGPEADRWLARGLRILERQLHEQVLPDGGHFERSPMYHAAALEELLDLLNLLRAYGRTPPPALPAAIQAMRAWLQVMIHPDGEIPFFNDAAFGQAPRCEALEAYAARLELPEVPGPRQALVALGSSGYVRALAGPAHLVCDCAAVGPDHQPGHAHADTLSFELSLCNRRVLVNSGTSQYGSGPERQRQRGTAAHNTVALDGLDSSEVWNGFRVARRARARLHAAQVTPAGVLIEASHDGYRRLPGHNLHFRRWLLDAAALRIEDRISGMFQRAEAYFHLHPEIGVQRGGSRQLALSTPDGAVALILFENAAAVEVIPGTWHPRFGEAMPNLCVIARFAGATLTTRVSWTAQA